MKMKIRLCVLVVSICQVTGFQGGMRGGFGQSSRPVDQLSNRIFWDLRQPGPIMVRPTVISGLDRFTSPISGSADPGTSQQDGSRAPTAVSNLGTIWCAYCQRIRNCVCIRRYCANRTC
ncbi:hypothetical protein DPMN_077939 [Dreissena polymorpha]|uniref:Uncharacterized protein n=1 Tax=Dreissena polymorpha TaxID=45954 RepID=A0A9D3YLT3_DREPO|nr:hypothetical protein DPMN_077939 [Dreissena polymorpha]